MYLVSRIIGTRVYSKYMFMFEILKFPRIWCRIFQEIYFETSRKFVCRGCWHQGRDVKNQTPRPHCTGNRRGHASAGGSSFFVFVLKHKIKKGYSIMWYDYWYRRKAEMWTTKHPNLTVLETGEDTPVLVGLRFFFLLKHEILVVFCFLLKHEIVAVFFFVENTKSSSFFVSCWNAKSKNLVLVRIIPGYLEVPGICFWKI